MLHLIMTLLIYGVDTISIKCPETCDCTETLVSDNLNNNAFTFDITNVSDKSSNSYKNLFYTVSVNETDFKNDFFDDVRNFTFDGSQTKKCAKHNKDNVRDIFLHNYSPKPNNDNVTKIIRAKRTLKPNTNETENGKQTKENINEIPRDFFVSKTKLEESEGKKDSENARNKDIFTYQITCNGLRDLKPLWIQYLPNPTTQLNIRQAFFQSFTALQQILKESPVKLNQLTVLSVSDSVINQKPDKKISFEAESTNAEGKMEGKLEAESEEKRHSEFLPFASLQNPKLRSKSDFGFTSKAKCKNMQVLNLVNNTITYLPQDTFHPFINLQVLNLSNNLLEFIDNEMFASLVNLLQLDIHNNRLKSLNEIMFKNLSKLLFLDVSQNLISNIAPSTFQYLISLNVLNLASNPLSEKQEAMILLGTGKRLQVVDISKTGLKQIPGTLERSVRVLNLMGNLLLSIRCGDLDSYSLLSYLNLRGNKIIYVEDDALGRLEFLNNLQISENNLFQIPKSLPNNLEILNLSYNNIQNITNLDFLNLSLLKELSLSYNQVSNVEGNAFNNLLHLKVLDLSRNPILILPSIYGRVKLSVLNLSYFTNIPGSYSSRYKQFPVQSPESITTLILESSPVLTKIFLQDTQTLQSFVSLQELDLRFTNLTTIRKDIFSLLPKLKVLKVEGNPWHCGKEILILSNWLKAHESEDATEDEDEVNTAHCSTPSNLYKTPLMSLEERDFMDFAGVKINSTNRFISPNQTLRKEKEVKNQTEKSKSVIKMKNNVEGKKHSEETLAVKKVDVKKYNKNGVNVKLLLNNNKTESCCGKSEGKTEKFSQKNYTAAYSQTNKRNSTESSSNQTSAPKNHEILKTWNDNVSDFSSDVKNSLELKSSEVSLGSVKKAEAVTAKDSLSLKREYNSHLSFLILSSVGLIVMAILTFTSIYFSRNRRRTQIYHRQNQDIEVCSISSLRNELW